MKQIFLFIILGLATLSPQKTSAQAALPPGLSPFDAFFIAISEFEEICLPKEFADKPGGGFTDSIATSVKIWARYGLFMKESPDFAFLKLNIKSFSTELRHLVRRLPTIYDDSDDRCRNMAEKILNDFPVETVLESLSNTARFQSLRFVTGTPADALAENSHKMPWREPGLCHMISLSSFHPDPRVVQKTGELTLGAAIAAGFLYVYRLTPVGRLSMFLSSFNSYHLLRGPNGDFILACPTDA